MLRRVVSLCASAVCLVGCAIHPLPEDVTGVDTYHIVRQIRCETREALKKELLLYLYNLARDHPDQAGDAIAQRIVRDYENDPESISTFNAGMFPGPRYVRVRQLINTFADTGIGYSFDLTMTEDNNLSTDINLLRPLTNSTTRLGISAGAMRKRNNHRVFTVTDNFGYLLAKLNTPVRGHRYCDNQIVQANYVYPIAGRIGVDRLVHDFVTLTLLANLGGADAKPGEEGPPTMADTLTFTTTVNLSATPKVEFSPVNDAFQLANASFTAEAIRTDAHQVSVALAITPTGAANLGPLRSYLFSTERGARVAAGGGGARSFERPVAIGERVIGGGTASERLALLAIDQLKRREFQLIPPP
jgi:hypothetical protein